MSALHLHREVILLVTIVLLAVPSECGPQLFASFLSSLAGGDVGNGTSPVETLGALALAHLQHKVDALAQFQELLSLGANATEALFLN